MPCRASAAILNPPLHTLLGCLLLTPLEVHCSCAYDWHGACQLFASPDVSCIAVRRSWQVLAELKCCLWTLLCMPCSNAWNIPQQMKTTGDVSALQLCDTAAGGADTAALLALLCVPCSTVCGMHEQNQGCRC